MIPKTIHYCWFSGEPFPVEVKSCLRTWKKILPDFKLRLWTYEDAISANIPFVNEALSQKKWTFACDVIRIYALFKEGGVYMDSDIRILNRFDELLKNGSFATFPECNIDAYRDSESYRTFGLQAAFMFGLQGNIFCETVLNYYSSRPFIVPDGTLDLKIAPDIFAEIAEDFGFKYVNKEQHLRDDIIIYESKYMGSTKRQKGPETFAFHTIMHTWRTDFTRMRKIERKFRHYYRVVKYFFTTE